MQIYQIVYAIFAIILSNQLDNILCSKSDNENPSKSDLQKINKLKELLKLNQNDFDGNNGVQDSGLNQNEHEMSDAVLEDLHQQQQQPNQWETASDSKESEESVDEAKRSAYLRFGRAQAYLRFGKRAPGAYLRFGKRNPAYLRFGKRNPAYLRFGRSVLDSEDETVSHQIPK